MLLKSLETLIADDMFYAAGVLFGSLHVNSQLHEDLADDDMPLVDRLGDLGSLWCQSDISIVIYVYVLAFFEYTHRTAYARLGITEIIGYIQGTDRFPLLGKDQYGFKIHFTGFLHKNEPP